MKTLLVVIFLLCSCGKLYAETEVNTVNKQENCRPKIYVDLDIIVRPNIIVQPSIKVNPTIVYPCEDECQLNPRPTPRPPVVKKPCPPAHIMPTPQYPHYQYEKCPRQNRGTNWW